MYYRINIALTVALTIIQSSRAESIAKRLPDYHRTLYVESVKGISATSFSGVALHCQRHLLYVVDNGNATVYELTPSGSVTRELSVSGVSDLEGISHYRDDLFFIAEEGRSNILRAAIPQTGSSQLDWSAAASLNLAYDWANTGLEGVSYNPVNNTLYAVKEVDPPRLYRVTLDEDGGFVKSSANDPFNIENKIGDAADIHALNDGNFIIVNQEQRRLEGYGPKGEPLSILSLDMNKPEGIALDTSDGTLYIVGEPREFCVYKQIMANKEASSPRTDNLPPHAPIVVKPDHTVIMTVQVPLPCRIRIDCIGLDGASISIFEGPLDGGLHKLRLETPRTASGIRLLRLSSPSYTQITPFAIP